MNAIHVEDLTRKFGEFVAVRGVSFDVPENEVFGFLGPNGAGKTTTINMLCTLLRPSGGRAEVNGIDVAVDPGAVRQSIGLIFQDPSLDEQLTGRENLRFHAMLYDVARDDFRRRSDELLEMVDLTDKADDLVRTYSGGMKRRLEISRGLLHRPKVLFLDEPTLGLDPQTRRHIWEYLFRLRDRRGITMFMTTHYMDEAENCDRIAIIDHGQIVALDTPEGLKGLVGGDVVTVQTSDNAAAMAKLAQLQGIQTRLGPEGQVIVETDKGDQFIPQMISTFADGGNPVEVQSVNLRRPTLEDVFIKLTGRAIREEEASGKDRMRMRRRMFQR
ncbi:MAG: ABC transporter ATP-binding protein [Chloroflexi bacterium RBG_19FT_COMBO_62_14]|nr:MAG: ABC transporter ATP-binding protein [Chloroflexi bacterium RBG_19FT_COMBO_62_14]